MAEDGLIQLARRVGEVLRAHGLRLVTAESCTGGGIAAAVTEVPGSSAWFDRGVVSYSNASKTEWLDVPVSLLAQYGAVSEAVVAAMTAGALARSSADIALAVSGIAGPEGGTPEKPVGTICLAWQYRNEPANCRTVHFSGERGEVRRATVVASLEGLLERVLSRPRPR